MSQNPLALALIILAFFSLTFTILPRVLRWDWSTKYFFVSSLQLGSIGLLGLVPGLCFLLYASIPLHYRIIAFSTYFFIIFFSIREIISMYLSIKKNEKFLAYIYQKSDNQYFYLQKNDSYIMEKKYKLNLFPSAKYFLIFSFAAVATIPFAKSVVAFVGLPYPHIFLGIFSIAIDIMALAFVVRGWFVLIHLPKYATKQNGPVYVDMSSRTKL